MPSDPTLGPDTNRVRAPAFRAWLASTARAAPSASTASLLPFWCRSWRLARLTSNTVMTAFSQEAAGPVGAGALDANGSNGAQRCRPGCQCLISVATGRDGCACLVDAQRADSGDGVSASVGVVPAAP